MTNLRSGVSNAMANSFNDIDFGKMTTVGIKNNRIEFRSMGGSDYLDDFAGILKSVNRFIAAYAAAADPDAYTTEYAKKLYKLGANVDSNYRTDLDKGSLYLFAKFGSGLMTKDELITRLKALQGERSEGRATTAVDIGEIVKMPDSIEQAIHMIADRHAIIDIKAKAHFEDGMSIEEPTHPDTKKAAIAVFKNLMNDEGHYQ